MFGPLYCVAQFVLEYFVKNKSKNKAGKLKFSGPKRIGTFVLHPRATQLNALID